MSDAAKNNDPFYVIECQIEARFLEETEPARQKRDAALKNLQALREAYGKPKPRFAARILHASDWHIDVAPAAVNGTKVSLKVAMTEAIDALKTDMTRKRVLTWAYDKYPHLKGAKEGTIASTFSRLKALYLERQDDETNLFKRKEVPVDGSN